MPKGDAVDLGNKLVCAGSTGAWPRTVALVEGRRIVAGNEEVVRRLAAYTPVDRGDVPIASRPLDLLLKKLVPTGEVAVLIDLSTARAAWKSPGDWLDVWPNGKSSWRLLCETPLAMALSIKTAEDHRCELGLARPARRRQKRSAWKWRSCSPPPCWRCRVTSPACKRPCPAANSAPPRPISTGNCWTSSGIAAYLRLRDGRGRSLAAAELVRSRSAELDRRGAGKRRRLESRPAGRRPRRRRSDEQRPVGGLLKYLKVQSPQRFPAGAASFARSLGPETRLSWIAELLPYLGHNDWNLDFGSNWNSPENQRSTRRPLPEVVNPALRSGHLRRLSRDALRRRGGRGRGRRRSAARRSAGGRLRLRAADAAAGPRPRRCKHHSRDGRPRPLRPLGAGRRATVRPLTQRPYINGPDGFGSGQADGMVVGMADGSARFLSDKIDPEILEKLVAVRGGDKVDMSAIDPDPSLPRGCPGRAGAAAGRAAARAGQAAAASRQTEVEPAIGPPACGALGEPVQKLSLSKMPLGDAVRLVASVGALKVSFDPDAMEDLGVTLRDPVSIEAAGATVGTLLDQIASARSMAREVENGQIVLTSKPAFREECKPSATRSPT